MNPMKIKFFIFLTFLFVMIVLGGYFYLFSRWKHLWKLELPQESYHIAHHQDDTLRVVMVGDSWAGMHHPYDEFLQSELLKASGVPVVFESKGKGGEKTKGIYRLMFEETGYGTRLLMTSSPDYCIISAGINDAAANLGPQQYCYYYFQIIELLLKNQIKPVVLDFPNVNIWTIFKHKPIKDLCADYLKSMMTHCGMYEFSGYREALRILLVERHLMEQVIYIPVSEWYGKTYDVNMDFFLDDQIHLNQKGYELLDICIAKKIAKDYNSRRIPLLSINQ